MEDYRFAYATDEDLSFVEAILSECELPYQDVAIHLSNFIIAWKDDQPVGVIGLELMDSVGLVRSLAVSPSQRGQGLAHALYHRLLGVALHDGCRQFYLLTLTAEGFFSKLGFQKTDRASIPEAIRQTAEFQSLCPDTAVCMVKNIAPEARTVVL